MKTIEMILLGAILFAAHDAVAQETFPELDESSTRATVAVLRFEHGRHLPEPPECQRPGVLCLDPPPLALEVTTQRQVHGAPLPAHFTLFTTSHDGLDGYDFTDGSPSLVLVLDDGKARVMPRYSRAVLARDLDGRLAVPVQPYPVPWLPCAVMTRRVAVRGWADDASSDIARSADDAEVQEAPGWFVVDGDVALPRYGLHVEDIAQALREAAPTVAEFDCDIERIEETVGAGGR